jgi:FkbM family methyltransferase
MANKISTFIKKMIIGKKQNLVSLDDQYEVIENLLRDIPVTGILDAGASYGRVAKKLLRLFPEANVYAFEPNPIYCETLLQVQKENVRLHPCFAALSDFVGTADYYLKNEQEREKIAQTGMEWEHSEFNCLKVAQYVIDLVDKGYYNAPWMTTP